MTTEAPSTHSAVFPGSEMATNMPFFDGSTLVFCQSSSPIETSIPTTGSIWKSIRQNKVLAERLKDLPRTQRVIYRPWKLAYCNWADKAVHAIHTGLPANIPERGPAFYREGGRVHLSFISGGPTSAGFHYRLYVCSGPDLGHLEPPKPISKPPLFFGFVSPHHICWGARNIVELSERASGKTFRLLTSFFRVASVTFLATSPDKLLITGLLDREHRCQTVLYDLMTENVSDVSAGGPVYKSSLHGEHLVFAQKQTGSFEERELHHGDCTLSPSMIQISKED